MSIIMGDFSAELGRGRHGDLFRDVCLGESSNWYNGLYVRIMKWFIPIFGTNYVIVGFLLVQRREMEYIIQNLKKPNPLYINYQARFDIMGFCLFFFLAKNLRCSLTIWPTGLPASPILNFGHVPHYILYIPVFLNVGFIYLCNFWGVFLIYCLYEKIFCFMCCSDYLLVILPMYLRIYIVILI